jgi:uncharacterized protein (DUF433 family)
MATTTDPTETLSATDPRVARPLFTLRETATYLAIPESTVQAWARPKDGQPALITASAEGGRQARVPFVGFAEAFVLSAFRKAGVPLQRIRPAVSILQDEIGLDHALASQRLYTDGAEVLYDHATPEDHGLLEFEVVRTGQRQFSELVKAYLKRITYGDDGWAARLTLPAYERAGVVVDPDVGFGQPLVQHGGARVEDLVDRFQAGDSIAELARDFGVPSEEVEDVIRVATHPAG